MTFSNLCALYENACLDYEVSVLTEGADSKEAKTAKNKATGLAKKVFAAVGAAFEKLGQMIMRILTFIKRRFVREKVRLDHEIRITPANTYKKILSDVISYSISVDKLSYFAPMDDEDKENMKDAKFPDRELEVTPLKFANMPYGRGSVIDKTSYQEVLEKAKRITSKYERLEKAADNLFTKYADDKQKRFITGLKSSAYSSILRALTSIITHINKDIRAISNNAVPEDVASDNDTKGKADTNNESIMSDGLTRNELRAQLLIEAAELLKQESLNEALFEKNLSSSKKVRDEG